MRSRVEALENIATELNHIETPYESCEEYSSSGSEESADDQCNGFQTLRIIKDICDRELQQNTEPIGLSTCYEETETETIQTVIFFSNFKIVILTIVTVCEKYFSRLQMKALSYGIDMELIKSSSNSSFEVDYLVFSWKYFCTR